jgi:flavodoxin I
MNTLIVYDSFYGNTEKIAQAIGNAFAPTHTVQVVRVSELQPGQLRGVRQLIVGSPTRAFRPSPAIQAFLKGLSRQDLRDMQVAAFDTRVDITKVNSRLLTVFVNLFGYAAQPIARGLQKKGGKLVGTPEGFFVKDKEGPLEEGELERAAGWALGLR